MVTLLRIREVSTIGRIVRDGPDFDFGEGIPVNLLRELQRPDR
jgi:hypothetical protein